MLWQRIMVDYSLLFHLPEFFCMVLWDRRLIPNFITNQTRASPAL